MSVTAVRMRLEKEAGPVRQEGSRLLTSRDVLSRVAGNLPEHHVFHDWTADARSSVLVGGASVVATDEPGVTVARPARWRELEWIKKHPEQVASHRGCWVIITPDGIAASSQTGEGLVDAARERGISKPFVLWIPEPTPGAEIT